MMLLQPLLEGLRALLPKVVLKNEQRKGAREGQGGDGITESPTVDGKSISVATSTDVYEEAK